MYDFVKQAPLLCRFRYITQCSKPKIALQMEEEGGDGVFRQQETWIQPHCRGSPSMIPRKA